MLGLRLRFPYWYDGRISEHRAKKLVHMTAAINNVVMYCDLLKHVMVGNVPSLLLHIVHRTNDMKRVDDSLEHVTFNLAQYVPLQNKCFDTITVQLMNDFGEPVLFVAGKLLVVLDRGSPQSFAIKGCSPFHRLTVTLRSSS